MPDTHTSDWPAPAYAEPPSIVEAGCLAATLRRNVLGGAHERDPIPDISAFAAAAGAAVVEADLGVTAGGCEALLVPLPDDRFRIAVDPRPRSGWNDRPSDARQTTQRQRLRFRVAHELAHTLFYSRAPGAVPSRRPCCSTGEEAFCDRFAQALLLPDDVVATCSVFSELECVQASFDVSLEVAVRSYASVHRTEIALFYWAKEANPILQWANVADESRLLPWTAAIRSAIRDTVATARLRSADALLLRERHQAVIFVRA